MRSLWILALLCLQAYAKDMCHFLRTTRGDYLDTPCTRGSQETTVAGSFPSFADSVNLNPASIPTMRTPVGVEVIASNANVAVAGAKYNVALIKGFRKMGAAISTDSDTTFFNHGLYQASGTSSSSSSSADAVMPSLNLGAALAGLLSTKQESSFLPSYGVVARYNRVRQKWGHGLGASFNSKYLTIGGSAVSEKNSDSSITTFGAYSAGLKVHAFQADYTYLTYGKGSSFLTNAPTHIVSAAIRFRGFWLEYAFKQYVDASGTTATKMLIGSQVQLGKFLALGYLYNYIPGAHSLGAQIFL